MLRLQLSKTFTNENHFFTVEAFPITDTINSFQFLNRMCIVLFLSSHT